jgi:hypothetical protein
VSVRISQARGDADATPHGGSSSLISMLVGKSYSWKAAKARLPPPRQAMHIVRSPRLLLPLGLFMLVVLLWRSVGSVAGGVQRYVT